MIQSYHNLCSIEIQTIEHKEINSFKPVSFSKVTLSLHKNCCALIRSKSYAQSTGSFTLAENNSVIMLNGNGSIQLAATKKHLYLLELNRSEIFINKDYFFGYAGEIGIRTLNKLKTVKAGLAKVGKTESKIKDLYNFASTCTDSLVGTLEKDFITLQGNGLVMLALPFPLEFVQKTNQTNGSTTVNAERLIYFTLPYKLLQNGKYTYAISGVCEIGTKVIED